MRRLGVGASFFVMVGITGLTSFCGAVHWYQRRIHPPPIREAAPTQRLIELPNIYRIPDIELRADFNGDGLQDTLMVQDRGGEDNKSRLDVYATLGRNEGYGPQLRILRIAKPLDEVLVDARIVGRELLIRTERMGKEKKEYCLRYGAHSVEERSPEQEERKK